MMYVRGHTRRHSKHCPNAERDADVQTDQSVGTGPLLSNWSVTTQGSLPTGAALKLKLVTARVHVGGRRL